MILPIYTYGQPVLRKVAQDIPTDYPGLTELISDMFETLAASSGVGLAAPQIGKSIRVVVIDLDILKDEFPEYAGYRHVLQPHDEWVEGYAARVMQHEFDHLEGKMYVDHLSPFRKQMIRNKLKAMTQGKFRAGYRTKPIIK